MAGPVEVAQIIAAATFGLSALTLVSAFARRIAGPYGRRGRLMGVTDSGESPQAVAALQEDVEQLRSEMDSMRARLAELDDVQNRLDFAERMLAQAKERGALPGAKS